MGLSHRESPNPDWWKKHPHKHVGSIDDDCVRCGFSVYMDWHTDGFSHTEEVGRKINGH